ncbi:MAG TPA: DEAD/DEAH box helicase [Opitutaceae bacterium]|nr:DEAD/DEAH box helicase [Opitutaceae bacterium]
MPRVEGVARNLGLMLRVLLPPNLVAAAARDAIAARVEFAAGPPAPAPADLPAWLQRQLAPPARPPLFLQLTRARLRELILYTAGLPVFFWVDRPGQALPWHGDELGGVSEHLAEPAATAEPAPATPPPRAPQPRSRPAAAAAPLTVDGSEHFLALTLPAKDHPTYDEALALVQRHDFILEPSNRRWWLRDRHKTLNFLAAQWARLHEHFGAQFTANFEHNTAHLRPATLACAAAAAGDAFDVTLELQAGHAPAADVLTALAGARSYVQDGDAIVLLPPAVLAQLTEAQRRLTDDPGAVAAPRRTVRLSGARVAEADALLESLAPGFQPPAAWRERSAALRNLSALAPAPVPPALDSLLRPYQRLGAAWLWHLRRHDLAGILADEMGLGKTLEALALVSALREEEIRDPKSKIPNVGPSLVVCPASLVENWRREAARFAPELRVLAHHGGDRAASAAAFAGVDLVVTSYTTLVRDQALFTPLEFACVIGDEAQHIKNRRTQHAQALRALRARGRCLLTGTPLENRLDDLRALFEFLMPGYLAAPPAGARGEDRAWYDDRLRAQTAPYILRRTKGAVAPELPPKIEQTLFCELPPAQAALYRRWQEQGERELDALAAAGAAEGRLRLALLTQLLRLRQVCCDPRLVEEGWPADDPVPAKLEAFRELLAEAADDGHRLLVFSQFTSLLALLRRELDAQATAYCYLDGAMSARARQEEIDRFQQSPDVPVFLLSLKAGGTGLNLTGADIVIHFDPWWNPAVEAQATDRAHRIGQTRVVTSYKLICTGTVEEKVLQLQDAKRALLAGVFEASEAAAAGLGLADLRALLK